MPPLSSWKMPLVSPRQSKANVSCVVKRKLVRVDTLAGGLLDQLDGLGENREIPQAEEVHFQQAGPFDVAHRPLRDDFVFVLHAAERHIIGQRAVGDHHRRGMRADVAGQPLDLHRQVEQLADFAVGVVGFFQIGVFDERFGQLDAQFFRHHGHDRVNTRNRIAKHRPTSRIAARALSVPNVPIWATFASPYFCFTY